MNKNNLHIVVIVLVLMLATIPVLNAYRGNLKQKQANDSVLAELIAQQQAAQAALNAQKLAEEKIYLLGKFDPTTRSDFVKVSAKYNSAGYQPYLRTETMDAFTHMADAALKDGVKLTIASATRNFEYQKNLWNSKWTGATIEDGQNLAKTIPDGLTRFKKILEYSAVPGTSRHHWGTDIDINGADVGYFNTAEGEKVYDWLTSNAATYGFCQPYTEKSVDRLTGYNEEKWHWTYTPLSKKFTQEYKDLVTESDISGFDGDQYVSQENLIQNYVLGINPKCL